MEHVDVGGVHVGIPGSKLVVMPGVGHECYLESAEAFDGEVRTFLLEQRT